MELRRCGVCGNLKQVDKFKKDKRYNGVFTNICKICHSREYHRKKSREQRGQFLYKKKCPVCSKEFETFSKVKRKTCSKKCSHDLGRIRYYEKHPRVEVGCKMCGKIFIKGIQRVFCSVKCEKKWHKRYSNKKNGRVYLPLINIYDITDRKIRAGMIQHHINGFCTVPIPLIPHFYAGGTVEIHREKLKVWVERLWVTDFNKLIDGC